MGDVFQQAVTRTKSFLSAGMTMVESSPSREILDPKWKPSTPHEAPPSTGIASIFNSGDRRRYYWQCPHCTEFFMQPPGIDGFSYHEELDLFGYVVPDMMGDVGVPCRKCGVIIEQKYKKQMRMGSIWVPEGCDVDESGLSGDPIKSRIASFWMPGAAAAYQSWDAVVSKYLSAYRSYQVTGSEEPIKSVVNTEMGSPYRRINLQKQKTPEDYSSRAEHFDRGVVPEWVYFLTAAIDIQKNRFVVQVQGWGVGRECIIIDRFDIQSSNRTDVDGRVLSVDPSGHPEDWSVIEDEVLTKKYSGHEIYLVGIDTGGIGKKKESDKGGVTENAYEYWSSLKQRNAGKNLKLLKGSGSASMPGRVLETFPDSTSRKDRRANARGRIPVWRLNSNELKDTISSDLDREEPGPRYVHFGDWLDESFYNELDAEIRNESGQWINTSNQPNESWDLMYYNYALTVILGINKINWDNPPGWMISRTGNGSGGAANKNKFFIP